MFSEIARRYAPWSVSKLNTITQCAKSFRFKYVLKLPRGESGVAQRVGTTTHDVLQNMLETGASEVSAELFDKSAERSSLVGEELDRARTYIKGSESFSARIRAFEEKRKVVTKYIEKDFAFDTSFEACDYDAPGAIARGRIDYAAITDQFRAIILDHKTGQAKAAEVHATQLQIYLLAMFALHPNLASGEAGIHHVGKEELVWLPPYSRFEVRDLLRPWFETTLNRQSKKLAEAESESCPAKPQWYCQGCDYLSHCGEGAEFVAKAEAKRAAKAQEKNDA